MELHYSVKVHLYTHVARTMPSSAVVDQVFGACPICTLLSSIA